MNKLNALAVAVVVALSGCGQESTTATQPAAAAKAVDATPSRAEIDKAVDKYTHTFISHEPALATSLGLDAKEYGAYASRLPDYSAAGMQALQSELLKAADTLSKMQNPALNDADSLHLAVNEAIARYYAGDIQFSGGYIDTWGGHLPYVVNQISGPLMDIPEVMGDQQTVASEADAEDYLTRLGAFAVMIDQVSSKVKADADKGIILPKALYPNTLGYLANVVAPEAEDHSLVTSFAEKLEGVEGLDDAKKQTLVKRAAEIVTNSIYPAFNRVAEQMKALEQKAPTDVGIWAQPGGEAYYQHAIAYLGDSSMSGEEIHQVGLNEVKRITARMDEILKANGYSDGSVGERMIALNDEPRFLYPDSDEGRAELLAFLNGEIKNVMEQAPQLFSTLPPQKVEVRRVPVEIEAGAAGGEYLSPSLDGSRPGVFYINLKDMKAVPSFGLKTLTYHEAVPGHHFQIALNLLQTDIGLMRQNAQFNAYVEGWALYSELLAFEMGMYENDPWGDLGRLQAEVYRAARLVVDTGLHYKKWTRQQAIEYFAEATGSAMSDVTSAIDRYIAWPGQALGYKLGMLKLMELRDKAQKALGEQFDIKAFHDEILLKGARPMALVEQDIDRWIASRTKA